MIEIDSLEHFEPPAHPKGEIFEGVWVRIEPLNVQKHARDLYDANASDPVGAIWDYLPYGPFDDFETYAAWLDEQAQKQDPCFFAIIRKSDNKAVGVASYLRIKQSDGSIEVGHINYSPLLQRTTQATEAMFLMMQWAFEAGYRRYEWKCNARNANSRRAAQRLGFSYEGIFRQASISKGQNRDTAWFAAIDSEWEALKSVYGEYFSDTNFDGDGRAKVSLSTLTKPILYKTDTM